MIREDTTHAGAKRKRSKTGCSNCRTQRIKCDESYPSCQQCEKRQRVCDLSASRFRTYQSRFDVESEPSTSVLPETTLSATLILGRMGATNLVNHTDHQDASWPELRSNGHTSNREADSPTGNTSSSQPDRFEESNHPTGENVTSRSDAGLSSTLNLGVSTTAMRMRTRSADLMSSGGAVHIAGLPCDDSRVTRLQLAGSTILRRTNSVQDVQTSDHAETSAITDDILIEASEMQHYDSVGTHSDMVADTGPETSEERAFLLRHFSETPGRWMDLFDMEYCYSRRVPVLALSNPLIMYSACALAAKQLSAVTQHSPAVSSPSARPAERYFRYQRLDYSWYATKYYDAAISLLVRHISDFQAEDRHSERQRPQDLQHAADLAAEHQMRIPEKVDRPPTRYNDEILVAATILAIYEFLSGTAPTWSEHLDGTRSFLQLSDEAGFLNFQPSPGIPSLRPVPSLLLHAAFWNFARQDTLSALIHCHRTRLETEDLAMWKRMGLNLDSDGLCVSDNSSASSDSVEYLSSRADMVSNALVWLLGKVVNYIATLDDDKRKAAEHGSSGSLMDANSAASRWLALKYEVDVWLRGLPPYFQSCSRMPLRTDDAPSCTDCQLASRPLIDHETWYCDSMCASTMQSYHMAQIFLLIHKPPNLPSQSLLQSPGAVSTLDRGIEDALITFRQMNAVLQHHAVEICAIALSRPDEAARIHMLQPLYLAGRCLDDISDRRIIVKLIDGIEDEMGWNAKYRVESLLTEWDIDRSMLECRRKPF